MRKYTFSKLVIELTRRCNMLPICLHCMRGNPQNLTIKTEYLDKLLKQTLNIGEIMFTGGEPTLCLEELDYVISKLYEYKIPLFAFELTTNGLIYSEQLVKIIKKYSDLILLCRNIDFPNDIVPAHNEVSIQISMDKYHHYEEAVKANFEKYKAALKGIAQVTININGYLTKRVGNAKANNIRAYTPFVYSVDDIDKRRIGIVDKLHQNQCREFKSFNLSYPEYQVLICCPIELKCDGNLIKAEIGDYDYETMDNPKYQICNVNDDIYAAIIEHNKTRIDCSEWFKKQDNKNISLMHAHDLSIATELYNEKEKHRTLDSYIINNRSSDFRQ